MTRSTSKRRLSSFLPRALTPSNSSSSKKHTSSQPPMSSSSSASHHRRAPFLHLKFTSMRPVPQYGHQLPFAHMIDHTKDDLPDSLKTDVQREGIQRYLVQNFKEGSFVWEVVKERLESEEDLEGDGEGERKDSDGMYLVVNRSWARTVGDNKLHLSLYVYQEDKHCATWHAYTDRTISYSRESESTPADAADVEGKDANERLDDEEDEDEDEPPIPNKDPYSPPSALAQYVATMDSRPSSPFEPPTRDSERPRFDRPYKEPVAASPRSSEEGKDDKGDENRRARGSRKPRSRDTEEDQAVTGSTPEEEEEPRGRRSRSSRRLKKPVSESESEQEDTKKVQAKTADQSEEVDIKRDQKKRSTPVVKSKPIGRQASRSKDQEDDRSENSKSRSPSPVKTRSSRSKKREPSPESRSTSRSPPPSARSETRSPSPVPSPDERDTERGKRNRRPDKAQIPHTSPSPSRSPSPQLKSRSSRSKPRPASPARSSRPPSPEPVKTRSSRRPRSKSPSRSPSPVPDPHPTRSRSKPRARESKVEPVTELKKERQRSHSRSPSRSPSPPPARARSRTRKERGREEENARVEKVTQSRTLTSPGPPTLQPRHSRQHGRTRSPSPRSRSPSPPPPAPRRKSVSHREAESNSTAQPVAAEPTWRSVSRNRHRRPDESDEDTLVRGNLDDDSLDIPAGGETTLLRTKPRRSSAHKDESFDPEEVSSRKGKGETHNGDEEEKPVEPQTLKSAVGGWFKSVGSLIATEAKLVVGKAEEEVLKGEVEFEHWEEKEREEKRKRKEERARRRKEREKRKEREDREKRKKEEELESMVDRAEDAAEGMIETSERLVAKKEKEARREKEQRKEKKSRATDVEDSEEEEPVRHRRTRHSYDEAAASSTRSRSKHRRTRPVSPEVEETQASRPRHDREGESTRRSSRHASRRPASPQASDSDQPKEEEAKARPALRERAMSISASVDAGLKGLRDSVSKIVSDAKQVQANHEEESDPDRERRKVEREKRRIDKERKAIEEERRRIEEETTSRRSTRRTDRTRSRPSSPSAMEPSRPLQSSPEPVETDFEAPPSRPRRSNRQKTASSDEESESPLRARPPPSSARKDRQWHEQARSADPEESEASIAPPSRLRQRNAFPPPRPRSNSVTSDTDMSDAPSRASERSERLMNRSESEADTEAHILAKRNARKNSTTIPIETIKKLREEHFNSGTRSIPSSPISTTSRQNFPSRSQRLEEDLRRGGEGVLDYVRKEKDHLEDDSKHRRKLGYRSHMTDHHDEHRSTLSNSRRTHAASTDEDQFETKSNDRNPKLPLPSSQSHPRRLSPAPLVASPVSPYGAYSPTEPPVRPQPVKPRSWQDPPRPTPSAPTPSRSTAPAQRSYTPVSTDESSDEADPSRPPSVRSRRGYPSGDSTGGSEIVPPARKSRMHEDSDPSPSYRFPPPPDSDSEYLPPRRNPSVASFSRTQPSSYPFTTDDEQDSEPAPPRKTKSSKPSRDDRFDSAYEESEPDSYARTSNRYSRREDRDDASSVPYTSSTHSTSTSGRGGGGGSRTMVSKPSSTRSEAFSSTREEQKTSRLASPVEPDRYSTLGGRGGELSSRHVDSRRQAPEVEDYSTFSRATTPYTSGTHSSSYDNAPLPSSFTPDYESPPSTSARRVVRASSPPRGFTGFDLRSQPSSSAYPTSDDSVPYRSAPVQQEQTRSREEERKPATRNRKGVSRSAVPFGANQAPVGRRMAKRLGLTE